MLMIFKILLFLIVFPVYADIFQWVDKAGNKHFSDRPQQGAEIFKIEKTYTYYQVKKVFDGDTILLSNGKKVRFLGINTPEVESRNKPTQAGGAEAKRWLTKQLLNKKVRLEKDVEKKDKYDRLLAYIFTEDNRHLNLELLERGLATVSIYPPNIKYTGVFVAAAKLAEDKGLGIWGYAEYELKQAVDIKQGRFKGWQRVVGKVQNIRRTRKNVFLKLTDGFSVQISKKMLKSFPDLGAYLGKQVEVRGWIRRKKARYSMFVRHPSALLLMSEK